MGGDGAADLLTHVENVVGQIKSTSKWSVYLAEPGEWRSGSTLI